MTFACDGERKSTRVQANNGSPEPASADEAGTPDVSAPTPEDSQGTPTAVRTDTGSTLAPPTDSQRREGKTPTSSTLAEVGSYGARPSTNWIFDPNSDGGFFLVASSSRANAVGGDVVRRVDLLSTPAEYDFNPNVPGTQGMHIMLPDELRGEYPKKDVGGDGLFVGSICGIIPGPDNRVIAFTGSGAFVLDPYRRELALTPELVIHFPYAHNACDGTYSKEFNKIYVVDVVPPGGSNAQQGIYVSDLPSDPSPIVGSLYTVPTTYGFNTHSKNRFQSVDLFDDKLYLIEGTSRFDAEWESGIHVVPLNEFGEPLFSAATLVRSESKIERAQGCTLNPDNTAASLVVGAKGRPTLLLGATQSIAAFDLSSTEATRLDLDPSRPGIQALDLQPFGQGNPALRFSPDGNKVYAMPHCRSRDAKAKVGGNYADQLEQRLAVFDLSGESPIVNPSSVDAGYLSFVQYLAKDLKPSYMPRFAMTFRDMAVGTKHIGIVGAGASGASGLGAGADLVVIDLATAGPIAFDYPKDPKKAHELNYGLKLGKDDASIGAAEITSRAIIWIP
jgi:hypothetical protein